MRSFRAVASVITVVVIIIGSTIANKIEEGVGVNDDEGVDLSGFPLFFYIYFAFFPFIFV